MITTFHLSTTMPRPAAKRTRPTTKARSASTKRTASNEEIRKDNNHESTNNPHSSLNDVMSMSRPADDALASNNTIQRHQTPMSKTHEQAIESSPMGERTATGSRHLTRARGYSSTLSLGGRKGDMSSKVPGTPAFESSVLSNFRRRARQPSILQMMQTEDGSSEIDDDDFLGGLSPEDESTPLNVSRGKSLVIRNAKSSQSSSPSSDGLRKRKREAEKIQVPQSPMGIVESTPIESSIRGIQKTEFHARTNTFRPAESPEAFSQTMAAQVSSSAPQSPIQITQLPTSDRLSPAILKHAKESSKQADGNPEHLTTATLQNKLLPRRRQRRRKQRGTADFDTSSDGNENENYDELIHVPSRKPSRTQRKNTDRPSSKAKQGKRKHASKKSDTGATNPSTSSRAVDVDKENQPTDMSSPLSSALDSDAFDTDVSMSMPNSPGKFMSEELRSQAKKFAEVDKWQMEYEDVISNAGSQGSTFR